jgi:hypothetical protein
MNKFRSRYAYALLVKSMSCKMLLEMRRGILTNHVQQKLTRKIDRESMHKMEQELKNKQTKNGDIMICFLKFGSLCWGFLRLGWVLPKTLGRAQPFPISLLDFFLCGGKITPSQTSGSTPQSLGAHWATPCRLGDWIPRLTNASMISLYELGCSRMDLLTFTQSSFLISLSTPTHFSSQISYKFRVGRAS